MERVKVFVRVRPLAVQDNASTTTAGGETVVQVSGNDEITVVSPTRQVQCRYDHIFDQESTQAEIYHHVKPSVSAVLKGINSTIFAYGQTGSGKTYTMMGRESCIFDEPGIVPRCINDIFQFAARRHNGHQSISVYVSFIQVYNEQAYDMLDDPKRMKPLAIHETSNETNNIPGLTEYHVHSYQQCLALIEFGLKNRAIRETAMNNASSRSHSILQVVIEQSRCGTSGAFESSTSLHSKLNLVDLAGSERWSVSHTKGREISEGQISELTNINSSLYTLGRCIAALANKSRQSESQKHIHVPYRDSKLTRLLQDSLGGNSKIFVLATINPSIACSEESISTLRFADRAHQVMTFAQVNENLAPKREDIKMLQQEITRLKRLLRSHGINDSPQISLEEDEYDDATDTNIYIFDEQRKSSGDHHRLQQNKSFRTEAVAEFNNDDTLEQVIPSCVTPFKSDSTIVSKRACEKIIDALDMVVSTVDSFLKTMKLSNSSSSFSLANNSSSQEFDINTTPDIPVEDDCNFDCEENIHPKQGQPIDPPRIDDSESKTDMTNEPNHHMQPIQSNGDVISKRMKQNSKHLNTNNSEPKTTKFKQVKYSLDGNTSSSSSLTSLLQLRQKLKGVDAQEEKLKEQIQIAKKQKEKKLQLRHWLLEKEEKSQYHYHSFNKTVN